MSTTDLARPAVRAARFPALVGKVAHWTLIQSTRIKVLLPEKSIARDLADQHGIEEKDHEKLLDILKEQGIEMPEWVVLIRRTLDAVETSGEREILREWRSHPLRAWGLGIPGVGEHSLAVITGLLDGDPYIAYPKVRVGAKGNARIVELDPYVRTLGQLRAYCGAGDPTLKRRRGMSQEDALAAGKPLLKARLHLLASSMLTSGNRALYDEAREGVAGRGWSNKHEHFHALRVVYKDFLGRLYDESKRLHVEGEWGPC